jgi:hypothetical protein
MIPAVIVAVPSILGLSRLPKVVAGDAGAGNHADVME